MIYTYYHAGKEEPLDSELFVFGSNLQGVHGAGAAKEAVQRYGALRGKGRGMHGQSYAIPTRTIVMSGEGGSHFETLPLEFIKKEVQLFVQFTHEHPELSFFVTPIGTGLAGYPHADIAPLFKEAKNCRFSLEWKDFLEVKDLTTGSLIIAGSRSIDDVELVRRALSRIPFKPTQIVSGRARGVDRCGEVVAKELGIPVKHFVPNWDKEGKRAGYLRNSDMGIYADAGLLLWDGSSNGTVHMQSVLKKLGKPCWLFTPAELRQPVAEPVLNP